MKARLKADYIYPAMRACGGIVFNKTDWTEVPPEQEKSAVVNADLEVQSSASEYLDAVVPAPTAKAHLKTVKADAVPAPTATDSDRYTDVDLTVTDPYTDAAPESTYHAPVQATPVPEPVKVPVKKAWGK